MFASRSGVYAGSPYGNGIELGGYGVGGWSVSAGAQEAYCNGSGGGSDSCVPFPAAVAPTSMSYGAAAVPLFAASSYDNDHQHHHVQHYHHHQQQQKQSLEDLDEEVGEFDGESSRCQPADDNKDWIKYQTL